MRMLNDYDALVTGLSLRAQVSLLGRTLDFDVRPPLAAHAWQTSVSWSKTAQAWQATIAPGYVNGSAPIYRTDIHEQEATGRDFGRNPLTGLPYFSSFVFSQDTKAAAATRVVDIPLYDAPKIPLKNFRSLGLGGELGEAIPPLLIERGAAVPEVFGSDGRQTQAETPAKIARQLRAIDLVLHQPRAALTNLVDELAGLETGQSFDHQVLTTRQPDPFDALRVYAGRYQARQDLSVLDAVDALTGSYDEPAYDERKICTVYLLSPAGAPRGSQPDGSWTAAVKHDLFWSLTWVPAPLFKGTDIGDGAALPFFGLTALGTALTAPIVNTLSAATNDAYQATLNILRAKSQAGTFYTPTGGGHVYTPEPVRVAATRPNDKTARRLALQRAASQEAARAQAGLDPSFPYRALGFDPKRLTASS